MNRSQVAHTRANLSSCRRTHWVSFLSNRRDPIKSLKWFLTIVCVKSGKPHFTDYRVLSLMFLAHCVPQTYNSDMNALSSATGRSHELSPFSRWASATVWSLTCFSMPSSKTYTKAVSTSSTLRFVFAGGQQLPSGHFGYAFSLDVHLPEGPSTPSHPSPFPQPPLAEMTPVTS